jgi:hypothetical protein
MAGRIRMNLLLRHLALHKIPKTRSNYQESECAVSPRYASQVRVLVRVLLLFSIFAITASVADSQSVTAAVVRDSRATEILNRAVAAAGGMKAISAIHDITESGGVTFFYGNGVRGKLVIRGLGGNHFRMDADLADGKRVWIVRDGKGTRTEKNGKDQSLSDQNAIDLERLTFPIGHVAAAIADSTTSVAFLGVEQRRGRSVYRVKLTGNLGLTPSGHAMKDLVVDALTFDIVAVDDCNVITPERGAKAPIVNSAREVEFNNFAVVDGIRVPLSISTSLMGTRTLLIELGEVAFNTNLTDGNFTK